ncbi:MAG: DHH family phosphoesterase [Candidatus Thermoplasmatota archaeon]|nr:DHH family phosphoesterase [Candidatus Thermoplasmatota archaeon]
MEIKKEEKLLFLIHQHADPDAVGSAYFLQRRWSGKVASPPGPNRTAQNLLTFLDFQIEDEAEFDRFDRIVILDTPDPSQLDSFSLPEDIEKTIIDHHENSSWDENIFFRDRISCCEIVYEMVNPEKLTTKEGIALIAGILTDTSSLQRGTSRTFSILSEIMDKSGVTLDDVRSILFDRRTYSEKVARLKGAQRSSHLEVNGFIIVKTEIGAFEGSVSSYLLNGGADIALSGSENDDEFRISGRATEDVLQDDIDIGRTFKSIQEEDPEVSGGGHPGAGVLTGEGKLEKYLDLCVEKIIDEIKEKGLGKPKD